MPNSYLRRLIKENRNNLSDTDIKLANHFIELGDALINKTITGLSLETNVSQTTIFNFVKKLGFKGYKDFIINCASNFNSPRSLQSLTAFTDITEEDSSLAITDKIISFNTQSILNLKESLNNEHLNIVLDMIQSSTTIHFFGQGGSNILAYDSFHKFIRTKYRCNYIGDYHMQLSYLTKLNENDCVFLFSHSGESLQTINLAKATRRTNAKVIALTGNAGSELSRHVDVSLIVYSEESQFRTETLTSRILYLTVMDIIYTNIMYKNTEESQEIMDRVRSVISTTKNTEDFIV